MRIGQLKHRITVSRKSLATSSTTGYRTNTWTERLPDLPAKFLPGPGREYLASESLRAEVTGRFFIRYSADALEIEAGDRVQWDARVFAVKSPPLPDETARGFLILMVSENGGDGT